MVKKLGLCALLIMTIHFSWAQKTANPQSAPVRAEVDPRVELLAIMAKMAGLGGYDSKAFKLYIDDVNKHFGKDSLHPAILHLKELGKKSYLGFDAVMRMAIHLDYPSLTPKVKFSSIIPEARWTKEGAEKFIPLVQQFYKDTDFESFFRAHKEMYAEAEKRFQVLLDQADFDWFVRFYGYKPEGKFSVFLGLLNGNISYGPKVEYPNGKEEFYAIMANYQVDQQGLPLYGKDVMLPTVVHEFNHSFINHLIINDSLAIKPYGEKIHQPVRQEMQRNLYSQWIQTTYESLVRAAVIRYQMEHDTSKKEAIEAAKEQYRLGFLWIQDLVALLGAYENSRTQHKTFASFMPVIKAYFKDLATNMNYTYGPYKENFPKIIATSPIVNGATNVDTTVKEITIVFNKPMHYGWAWSGSDKDSTGAHFPIQNAVGWDATYTQFTMKFKKLKPNWDYEFWLRPEGFRSREELPLDRVVFKFKTK